MSAIRLGQTFLSIALLALLAVGSAAQTSSRSLSAPTDSADSSATPEAPSSNVSLSTSLPASAVASSPAASQTPVDSEDDQSFTWSDGSCSPEHQDLIVKAFRDANAMTRAAVEAETDHEHDPAFWELFGGRAVGDFTAIKSAFDQVLQGPWSITASCNFDGSVAECTDQRKYGGIGATEAAGQTRKRDEKASLSATLVFCQEFFRFPPLDHRVQMGINHPYYLEARYDLGYFHDNQGTTLLRTLFNYIPTSADSQRPILDLWVYMKQSEGIRWSACYGVYCAKILARLNDPECDWASLNADNYALYALSKYVAPLINNNFAWLPQMEGYPWALVALAAADEGTNAPVKAGLNYSMPTLSQPNYIPSRYQVENDVLDFGELLGQYRTADISQTPFRKDTNSYSVSYGNQRNQWTIMFSEAFEFHLINTDTNKTRTCYADDENRYPDLKPFNGTEAVEFASNFCNNTVSSNPLVNSTTIAGKGEAVNISKHFLLTTVSNGTTLDIVLTGDPATFLHNRNAMQFFEGDSENAKIDHCVLTFKDTIRYCGDNINNRKGGFIKLNDRIYAVYTHPTDNLLPNTYGLGEYKCADYNATSYWRIATFTESLSFGTQTYIPPLVNMTDTDKLSKLCTCWFSSYPFTADLFCKPDGGCDALAASGQGEVASASTFEC